MANRNLFDVSFTEFTWGSPDFTDIRVEIVKSGVRCFGRGTHADGNTALEKASAEALERLCCHILGISTVGCAVHLSPELAMENSRHEFIERYIFDMFRNGCFNSITNADSLLVIERNLPSKIWIVELGDGNTITICIFIDLGDPISIGISFGSDTNSFEKAYIEAFRNYMSYRQDRSSFDLAVKSNKDMWCCDKSFLQEVIFKLEQNDKGVRRKFTIPKVGTKTLMVSQVLGLSDCPFYFSRSEC